MKLKLLFFPIAVIVSISLIIGFISPEFSDVKEKRDNLKIKEKTLKDVMERKQGISSLTGNLDSNKAKESLAKSYLPASKYEEEVINKVYKTAVDSKVSLINLMFSDEGLKSNLPSDTMQQEEAGSIAGRGKISVVKIRDVSVSIELLGTYENMRVFLGNIYTMEKFNDISSIDISKVKESSGEETEEAPVTSNNLRATIDVKFNYLTPVVANKDYGLEVFSKKSFDFSLVDKLENMITKKIPDVEVGATGKSNPFVP
ncbi:hypothetical protein BMS3Abin15_01077 [bacterium BMS3Abin15]|nr:hypothetical protein BMS3Abin15_01077 [bacterium BMS3Abin15]HDZ85330.1 hypothetical protein [Candidatus Moranbacteria bacterium]